MNTSSLKISVLTPSFNSGKYIQKAIESVINQRYTNFEHIIFDGGSSDETVNILEQYPHLKWVSEKDLGQSDAMNKAFRISTGEIIVYLNADDWFESNTFEEVANIFLEQPHAQIVIGNLYLQKQGISITRLVNTEFQYKRILLPFRYEYPYNPVSYFYRKQVQENIGDFPIDEHYAMDYWFLLRAFRNSVIEKSGKVFGTFYETGTNKTASVKTNTTNIAKEFVKLTDFKTKLYFWSNLVLYTLFSKPYSNSTTIFKYFLCLLLSRKFLSYSDFKRVGFRNCIQ